MEKKSFPVKKNTDGLVLNQQRHRPLNARRISRRMDRPHLAFLFKGLFLLPQHIFRGRHSSNPPPFREMAKRNFCYLSPSAGFFLQLPAVQGEGGGGREILQAQKPAELCKAYASGKRFQKKPAFYLDKINFSCTQQFALLGGSSGSLRGA